MALQLRALEPEEKEAVEKLARSRTAPVRLVERAHMILLALQSKRVPVIAKTLGVTEITVRTWLKRFNDSGLKGLEDQPRAGRPARYTAEEVAEVIAAALTDPQVLGLPFGSWTLDRLQIYLNDVKQIPMKRSRIDELLIAEGLRWRTQETWFGARVDPDFAKKRGILKRSTRCPLRVVQ